MDRECIKMSCANIFEFKKLLSKFVSTNNVNFISSTCGFFARHLLPNALHIVKYS